MRAASSVAVLAAVACVPGIAGAGDANLDPTFGLFGHTRVDVVSPGGDAAQDVLVQPDGAIVAVGFAGEEVALVRLDPNGALDGTFGGGGVVTTAVGGGSANVVARQPDGKLVIAGYAGSGTGNAAIMLARCDSDGNLDPSFGAGASSRAT